jgi:hypothetical protein
LICGIGLVKSVIVLEENNDMWVAIVVVFVGAGMGMMFQDTQFIPRRPREEETVSKPRSN